jgi:hypothetical protein
VGSVLGGPLAARLHDVTASWIPVFVVIIAMNFATALLAWVALKPMRRRWLERADDLRASRAVVASGFSRKNPSA